MKNIKWVYLLVGFGLICLSAYTHDTFFPSFGLMFFLFGCTSAIIQEIHKLKK